MKILACKPAYSADKAIKACADLVLKQICVYKLVNGEYELFYAINIDKKSFSEYKEIHISDTGKVITLLREGQTISTLFVDQYVQRGTQYVAYNPFG